METTTRSRFGLSATLAGLGLTITLLGAGCNGCNQSVPPQEIPTYTSKRVIDPVVWPDPSTINQAALAAMKPEEAAKVALSGVPVLVPSDPKLLGAGVGGETNEFSYDYGLDDSVDGISFTINASRVSTQSDAPSSAPAPESGVSDTLVHGHSVSISQNDTGNWIATWGDYGEVGYLLHVACDSFDDSRCADDTYIKSLVASLVYVGGNGK